MSQPPFLAGPLPAGLTEAGTLTGGETWLFWIVGGLAAILALGLVFARRAAYAAICLVGVMVCLAILYTAQEAPFLGVVQVVVYTGAIMMLFLFVLMLIGVDATDSSLETLTGQRLIAAIFGLGLLVILAVVLTSAATPAPVGLAGPNADTNPTGVARLLFSEHILSIQLSAALLVVAALGALTLTHKQRLRPVLDQRATAEAKMQAYAEGKVLPNQKAAPGVYARSLSAASPALSGTGAPILDSVPQVLRIRGQVKPLGEVSPESVEAVATQQTSHEGLRMHGGEATRSVGQSSSWGMAGAPAPQPAALEKQRREELEARRRAEVIESGEDK